MNFQNIPQEMKALPQWSCHRLVWNEEDGKYKKIIISPRTGKFAACNNPSTWTDFESAKQYCKKYNFHGLTFALTKGITFIDIDRAIDKITQKIVSSEAIKLLELLPNTFTELSASGTGLHILMRGNLPNNALKRNDAKGLEMYDTKRFICMTGNLLNSSINLADYSNQIADINRTFMGERKTLPPQNLRSAPAQTTDTNLIERISKSKQSAKFERLYYGNTIGYASQSNADFALVNILAWWTKDVGQIERIFRSSGLMRDKFDRRTGDSTYGANLIHAALNKQPAEFKSGQEM